MSLLVINIIILLFVGFINDSLNTYYIRLISERRSALATLVNFIHSMVGWAIWIWFMHQFQSAEAMTAFQMFIYSLGGAAGTYMGLRGSKPGSVP